MTEEEKAVIKAGLDDNELVRIIPGTERDGGRILGFRHSEPWTEVAAAFCAAQAELEAVKKDSANPDYHSKYASLGACIAAIREAFSKHDLSFLQPPRRTAGGIIVDTMILHKSGQWLEQSFELNAVSNDAQSLATVISYARRYSLAAFVGLAQEDDDGNEAKKTQATAKDTAVKALEKATTLADMEAAFKSFTPEVRKMFTAAEKDKLKARFAT